MHPRLAGEKVANQISRRDLVTVELANSANAAFLGEDFPEVCASTAYTARALIRAILLTFGHDLRQDCGAWCCLPAARFFGPPVL
jgi:hypothetical protein